MIKVNELRVGNLIYAGTDEDDQPQAGKVLQIFEDVIHWTFDLNQNSINEGYNATDLRYVNPIPLTPEWLERCGFKKGASYIGIGYHWDGPNDISIVQQQVDKEDTYRLFGSEWTIGNDFKYLHQLQNLYFALTGEELQIKLQ